MCHEFEAQSCRKNEDFFPILLWEITNNGAIFGQFCFPSYTLTRLRGEERLKVAIFGPAIRQ